MAAASETPTQLAFPKPTKRIQKRHREEDKDYIHWLHTWSCCVCGNEYAIHAHHVISRGAMGSDKTAVPLCSQCHTELHTKGKKTFEEKYRVNLLEKAEVFYKRFLEGITGHLPMIKDPNAF